MIFGYIAKLRKMRHAQIEIKDAEEVFVSCISEDNIVHHILNT